MGMFAYLYVFLMCRISWHCVQVTIIMDVYFIAISKASLYRLETQQVQYHYCSISQRKWFTCRSIFVYSWEYYCRDYFQDSYLLTQVVRLSQLHHKTWASTQYSRNTRPFNACLQCLELMSCCCVCVERHTIRRWLDPVSVLWTLDHVSSST